MIWVIEHRFYLRSTWYPTLDIEDCVLTSRREAFLRKRQLQTQGYQRKFRVKKYAPV